MVKTTLLAALLSLVPAAERVVTVEEARELRPAHPHVVHLAARRPNVEGAGAVDLADLVRNALRMRPDRIVLGECRGAEVREVLMAMNTGHDGGFATLHANSVSVVPARLEALAGLAGMSREAVAAQAAGALDVVLHLRRSREVRYLAEIGLVGRTAGGELEVRTAARWGGGGAAEPDPGAGCAAGLDLGAVAAEAPGRGAGGAEAPSRGSGWVADQDAWDELVGRYGPW